MPLVSVLQHDAVEPLGTIADALGAVGIDAEYIRIYAGDPVPADLTSADGLIVMGGPMGVYEQDRYPFLAEEIRFIQRTFQKETPILGVCLGSQLLAAALGAPVAPGPQREIGWYPITLTEAASEDALWAGAPANWMGFHWHGDIHGLPPGATLLARSELTPCQAFRAGRHTYGLQFHMEVTRPIIGDWLSAFADEALGGAQSRTQIVAGADAHLMAMLKLGKQVFGRWARLVAGS